MSTDWKAYGKALKKALWANVCVVGDEPGLQCGWMDGGCFIAAHAVARIVDGELWGIWSATPHVQQVEHVVVRTPDGAGFLDADGFSDEKTLLRRWRKELAPCLDRPSVSLVHLARAARPPGLDEVVCQVGLADVLEKRLRPALPPYPRQRNPVELDPFTMTTEQIRAVLRGMYQPLGGNRAALEARLALLVSVRARYAGQTREQLSALTVPALKAALRSVDWSTGGDKARLVRTLHQLATMPLVPESPRKRPTARVVALVWNNPFTGRRELRSHFVDAESMRAAVRRRLDAEQWAIVDGEREHGLVFSAPEISWQNSDDGLPQTTDEDLERWAAIVSDVEGRTLPRVGLNMNNAEAHTRENRARFGRIAGHVAANREHSKVVRSENPTRRRFVSSMQWAGVTPESVHAAEELFRVKVAGAPYGCGQMGCAFPIWPDSDSGRMRVLKITKDPLEAEWANQAYRHHPMAATAKVFAGPRRVSADDAAKALYAYVREEAGDIIDEDGRPALVVGGLNAQQRRASIDQAVADASEAFAAVGHRLSDTKDYNMGITWDGRVVVRDGRSRIDKQ